MNFGTALEALKQDKKIARKAWNGKGMYLFLVPGTTVPLVNIHTESLRAIIESNGAKVKGWNGKGMYLFLVPGTTVPLVPAIRMYTADATVLTGWLASQNDMLADDWEIVA